MDIKITITTDGETVTAVREENGVVTHRLERRCPSLAVLGELDVNSDMEQTLFSLNHPDFYKELTGKDIRVVE